MSGTFVHEDPDLLPEQSRPQVRRQWRNDRVLDIFIYRIPPGREADFIRALYWFTLRRLPASHEVGGWTRALAEGLTPAQVVHHFLASDEARAIATNLTYEPRIPRLSLSRRLLNRARREARRLLRRG